MAEMWEVQELGDEKIMVLRKARQGHKGIGMEMYSPNSGKKSPSKPEEVVHKQALQINRLYRAYHFVVEVPLNCFVCFFKEK